jgi:sulfate adenylyltransferase subunit 2
MRRELEHLEVLEAEAIHIFREVAAELEKPVLLFSGGKDSIVLLRLAEKAFRPGRFPFPLMHVDTGHNFPEVIEFRDRRVGELGERLIVASAKERIFSFRDDFGSWDPRNQRPELWNLYNGRIRRGEHVRVFPLSNWTELDVWQYIMAEELEVPNIYLSHEREVFRRDGMLYAVSDHVERLPGEDAFSTAVRYRTVGDMSCTGAVESTAGTLTDVVEEIARTRITERGETRADDRVSEAAMEDRKVAGYF